MKRTTNQATLLAYLGLFVIVAGVYPGAQEAVDRIQILHAAWHLVIFIGAGLLIYGLETLRMMARRHRRMIS